uniref:Uncharacterized protein n=1 Tax=Timema douglasi TaxID=61478 RepID=A0A7R8Z9D4_TIMDO|nr:unnamed protein product [Timema douglasi]
MECNYSTWSNPMKHHVDPIASSSLPLNIVYLLTSVATWYKAPAMTATSLSGTEVSNLACRTSRQRLSFDMRGPIRINLDKIEGTCGCAVIDLLFPAPICVGELVFYNYYTAWVTILVPSQPPQTQEDQHNSSKITMEPNQNTTSDIDKTSSRGAIPRSSSKQKELGGWTVSIRVVGSSNVTTSITRGSQKLSLRDIPVNCGVAQRGPQGGVLTSYLQTTKYALPTHLMCVRWGTLQYPDLATSSDFRLVSLPSTKVPAGLPLGGTLRGFLRGQLGQAGWPYSYLGALLYLLVQQT